MHKEAEHQCKVCTNTIDRSLPGKRSGSEVIVFRLARNYLAMIWLGLVRN